MTKSPVVIDWGLYESRRWVEVRGQHDAAVALREISKTVKKWNEGANGALKVWVRDGDAKDARNAAEWEAERGQAVEEESSSGEVASRIVV